VTDSFFLSLLYLLRLFDAATGRNDARIFAAGSTF